MKTKSQFKCPSCGQLLAKELHPNPSKRNPTPYVMLFCGNPRCPSDAAQNDGGSAETEHKAYLSLYNAVDNETEEELDEIKQRDRNEQAKADHANDLAKSGGA